MQRPRRRQVILILFAISNILTFYFFIVPLQKWSKGKVRDKLNNLVLFDKATYDKFVKEVPSYKLITPSLVSERMKIRSSLAKKALTELHSKGLVRLIEKHHAQSIYTRTTKAEAEAAENEVEAEEATTTTKGKRGKAKA